MSRPPQDTASDYRRWYEAVLANDEGSTDAELVLYFMREGGMSQPTAELLVTTRGDYLRGERG